MADNVRRWRVDRKGVQADGLVAYGIGDGYPQLKDHHDTPPPPSPFDCLNGETAERARMVLLYPLSGPR
jgi:hypothetical protein